MKGEITPLVLIPRYSSFVGEQEFTTVPLDVSAYTNISVLIWRGPLVGTSSATPGSPYFRLYFDHSNDCVEWHTMPPPPADGSDPGADQVVAATPSDMYRYVRCRVHIAGTGVAVSTWCSGFLEKRVS